MTRIVLYDKPECPFCWRVRLALTAQGRSFETLAHDTEAAKAERRRLSHSGTVPILVEGDLVLTDSAVILEYLADSGPGLLPAAARQRAIVRQRVRYIDEVAGRAIREVIFEKRDRPAHVWDSQRIEQARAAWLASLETVERWLSEDGRMPQEGALAAYALATRVGLACAYGVPVPDHLPRLQRWFTRMQGLPEFAATAPQVVCDALRAA